MQSGIKLGFTYKDTDTPFKGAATVETEYKNGCIRIVIEPRELKDGEPIKAHSFDYQQLELVEGDPVRTGKIIRSKIPLDAIARDKVTGLQGTVAAISTVLGGSPEIGIQPNALKPNGEVADAKFFTEDRVEIVKPDKATPKEKKSTGGPQTVVPPSTNDRPR